MEIVKSYGLKLLASLLMFLAPIKGLLIILLLAIVLDTLFGIYKTWKLYGKDEIKSHKMFNFVVKVAMYMFSVICLYLVDIHIFGSVLGVDFFFSKGMTLIFTFIELKSIDETSVLMGNKSLWDIISDMIKKFATIKKQIKENN